MPDTMMTMPDFDRLYDEPISNQDSGLLGNNANASPDVVTLPLNLGTRDDRQRSPVENWRIAQQVPMTPPQSPQAKKVNHQPHNKPMADAPNETLLETIMKRLDQMESRMNSAPTILRHQNVDNNQPSTIGPGDSSSELNRYNKNFWKPDYNSPSEVMPCIEEEDIQTILATGTQLSKNEDDVVRGFVKTRPMIMHEVRVNSSIKPVPGLQKIFCNPRLNFLAHLHTALHKISSFKEYPPPDLIERLVVTKNEFPRNPQHELLNQVISCTLDLEDMVVVSNPFSLPVLEVGMKLTEKYVFTCFDILNKEYESMWFETVKDLRVPRFHRNHSDKSDDYLRNSRRRRHSEHSKQKDTKSVFSLSSAMKRL